MGVGGVEHAALAPTAAPGDGEVAIGADLALAVPLDEPVHRGGGVRVVEAERDEHAHLGAVEGGRGVHVDLVAQVEDGRERLERGDERVVGFLVAETPVAAAGRPGMRPEEPAVHLLHGRRVVERVDGGVDEEEAAAVRDIGEQVLGDAGSFRLLEVGGVVEDHGVVAVKEALDRELPDVGEVDRVAAFHAREGEEARAVGDGRAVPLAAAQVVAHEDLARLRGGGGGPLGHELGEARLVGGLHLREYAPRPAERGSDGEDARCQNCRFHGNSFRGRCG